MYPPSHARRRNLHTPTKKTSTECIRKRSGSSRLNATVIRFKISHKTVKFLLRATACYASRVLAIVDVLKWLEIDQNNLHMKFSGFNADFSSPFAIPYVQ